MHADSPETFKNIQNIHADSPETFKNIQNIHEDSPETFKNIQKHSKTFTRTAPKHSNISKTFKNIHADSPETFKPIQNIQSLAVRLFGHAASNLAMSPTRRRKHCSPSRLASLAFLNIAHRLGSLRSPTQALPTVSASSTTFSSKVTKVFAILVFPTFDPLLVYNVLMATPSPLPPPTPRSCSAAGRA